jgi:hydrogenase expression/formation protein HypD
MGFSEYEELVRQFAVPIVVGGFEPVDLLEAILMRSGNWRKVKRG